LEGMDVENRRNVSWFSAMLLHPRYTRRRPDGAYSRPVRKSRLRDARQATGDSPLIYLQKLRVAAAKRMLENNHRSMQEISEAVGYQDLAFFRALFQRHTGVSPSAYRDRFGSQ